MQKFTSVLTKENQIYNKNKLINLLSKNEEFDIILPYVLKTMTFILHL